MLGLGTLRRVAGEVRRDLAAASDRDPAATGVSPAEILAAWPGVHALLSHRVAHALDGAVCELLRERPLARVEPFDDSGERPVGVGVVLEHAAQHAEGRAARRRRAHRRRA